MFFSKKQESEADRFKRENEESRLLREDAMKYITSRWKNPDSLECVANQMKLQKVDDKDMPDCDSCQQLVRFKSHKNKEKSRKLLQAIKDAKSKPSKVVAMSADSVEDKILEIAELSKIYQYLKSIGINASETRASIVNVARMISNEVDLNLSKVNEQFK